MSNKIEFNIKFKGEYALLKWIIKRYSSVLPYESSVLTFAKSLPHNGISTGHDWNKYGVPPRVWNSLHKDLVIAHLMGRIKERDIKTLEELKIEFNASKDSI